MSTEQVLKHVQEHPSYSGGFADGPTPVEVDRIEKGGKGKSKGKNKGKGFSGGEWMNSWAFSRGRGRGRQNKGKGKGKSKGKPKGKKQAKEIPRARKEVVQKWHMASAPTAMNTVIGQRTVPTW